MSDRKKQKKVENVSLSQRVKVFFKKFSKLDTLTKLQLLAIVAIIITIIIALISFIFPGNSEEVTDSGDEIEVLQDSNEIDEEYEIDEYTAAISEYEDSIIKENTQASSTYNRDILFVGDSNTEALATYGHVGLQQVMGITGLGIQSVTSHAGIWFVGHENPYTIPQAIKLMQPRTIIINFGTNNIGGMTVETFIDEYLEALAAIEKAYPYSNIIVNSIFPVAQERDYPNVTMQEIDEFNIALVKMCSENGYMFLNSSELLRDAKTGFLLPEYASSDGLHLSKEGLKTYIEYVGSHKYEVEDTRPTLTSIPTRRNPPVVATEGPTVSPTATPTLSPSPSVSPSPSASVSPSPSVSPTATATQIPTQSPTPTPTPTDEQVATDAPTDTPEPTPTQAPVVTDAPTDPPTDAPTATPSPTPTSETVEEPTT